MQLKAAQNVRAKKATAQPDGHSTDFAAGGAPPAFEHVTQQQKKGGKSRTTEREKQAHASHPAPAQPPLPMQPPPNAIPMHPAFLAQRTPTHLAANYAPSMHPPFYYAYPNNNIPPFQAPYPYYYVPSANPQ